MGVTKIGSDLPKHDGHRLDGVSDAPDRELPEAGFIDDGPIKFAEASAADSELSLKQLDCLDRCISQMHQVWNDRFDFARPELLKCYLMSEICIHLQFPVHFGETDCQDFGAIWFGPRKKIGPLFGYNLSDSSVAHLSAEIDRVGQVHSADNDRQQSMLVGIAEVVDNSQGVVGGGSSPICVSVGLKTFDDRLSAAGDSTNLS
jgi:hypothetical protein